MLEVKRWKPELVKMDNIKFDKNLFVPMPTGKKVDSLLSSEGGLMKGTNFAFVGDPGVGKSTVMLDILADLQAKGQKCLFISGEMTSIDMFGYVKRFPNNDTTKKLIKYYLEPYGWSRYIQNSGGYGIHMSCAYADLSKIGTTKTMTSNQKIKYRAIVKNKTDSSILIKAEGPTKETAEKEAMKICIGKSVQSSFKDACYVHYVGKLGNF